MVESREKLKEQLQTLTERNQTQKTQTQQLQADLKRLISKIQASRRNGRSSKDTIASLDKKARDLETKRTTTSLSLADERQILKQIHVVQKQKVLLKEDLETEAKIQEIKKTLDELKSNQQSFKDNRRELESALGKSTLADTLGCTEDDLVEVTYDCPKERVGAIIGKQGSMLKKLMDTHHVKIDVDKGSSVATITGNSTSVEKARLAMEAIATAIEVDVVLPEEVLAYLRISDSLPSIREEHPNLHMDLLQRSGKIVLRGAPTDVNKVQSELKNLNVVSKTKGLVGREFSALLGAKGKNIDRLVQEYKVSIKVRKGDDDIATAMVTGTPNQIDAAMDAIEALLDSNREVEEVIRMKKGMKDVLLAENGKHVKGLQAKVNTDIETISEGGKTYLSVRDGSLVVKARQTILENAVEAATTRLNELNSLILTKSVDKFVVPKIIGKGGETIQKLTQDKGRFLEVDRKTGEILLGATTEEARDDLLAQVEKLLLDNTVLRITPEDPDIMTLQFQELRKASKSLNAIKELAYLDVDKTEKVFILRGNQENIVQAKVLLEEFLSTNFVEEMEILDEDFDTLLSGGGGSKITSFAKELDVNLSADRRLGTVKIRGLKEKVKAAKSHLNSFLNGGDGQDIARLSISQDLVGVIVGRGGSRRKEIEEKHGVSIHISKTHKVSIRGPVDAVKACRIEVVKIIATAQVTQTVEADEAEIVKLRKGDTLQKIKQETSAQINIENESIIKIRGSHHDVKDAKALILEQMKGDYHNSIELVGSQVSRVTGMCRDPSHLLRVETDTNTKVSLKSGTFTIQGKRSAVKKAKLQLYDLISFACTGEIKRIDIPKPLFAAVGSSTFLANVSANTGIASIYLDRDINAIVLLDKETETIQAATVLVEQRIVDAERLVQVIEFSPADAWLLTYLIGTKGGRINSIRKGSGCKIDVSKETRMVTITGESEDSVSAVRAKVDASIARGRKENVFWTVPEKAIPAFVGKGNIHLKDWSKQYDLDIQRMRRTTKFHIVGKESAIADFEKNVFQDWLEKWEQKQTQKDSDGKKKGKSTGNGKDEGGVEESKKEE